MCPALVAGSAYCVAIVSDGVVLGVGFVYIGDQTHELSDFGFNEPADFGFVGGI